MNQIRNKHDVIPPEEIGFAELPNTIAPLEQPLRIGKGIMRNVVASPMSALDNIRAVESSASLHHK